MVWNKNIKTGVIFLAAAAIAASISLLLTTPPGASRDHSVPAPAALAKNSFGGISQVVQEHDGEDPFVILDIVPGKASYAAGGGSYELSLGTIGYLVQGQTPVEQDILRVMTGGEEKLYYPYEARRQLADTILGTDAAPGGVISGFSYEEAYGGTRNLTGGGWNKVSSPVEGLSSAALPDESLGQYPTGRLYAQIKKRPEGAAGELSGYDYDLTWTAPGVNLDAAGVATLSTEASYRWDKEAGDVHPFFGDPAMNMRGYRAAEVSTDLLSYPLTTGVYRKDGEGRYSYAGAIWQILGLPEPKAGQPTQPAQPEQSSQPEQSAPKTPLEAASEEWRLYVALPPAQVALPAETFYVVTFSYVEKTAQEGAEFLYQAIGKEPISQAAGVPRPFDSYLLQAAQGQEGHAAAGASVAASNAAPALEAKFFYVGGGKGTYRLTAAPSAAAVATGIDAQAAEAQTTDIETQATGTAEESIDARIQATETVGQTAATGTEARAAGPWRYVGVQNAPVYLRCTGGSDALRQHVFQALRAQDNQSDAFAIRVDTAFAGDVTDEMVKNADLVYLEEGLGRCLQPSVAKTYIGKAPAGQEPLKEMDHGALAQLFSDVAAGAKPLIVDYGIVTDTANYQGSEYQKLAKAFLKKDLAAFYGEMGKNGALAENILMNADKDLKDHPDKTDNDYHYVNHNVYLVNGTSLSGEDFALPFTPEEAEAGFSEALAAIRAENALLPEEEQITAKISKAMAVQYIVNYSLGLAGGSKDISILELQPAANPKSDLHRDANADKGTVVLYWQREDGTEKGRQILRSSKMIGTEVSLSSVAAFNSSRADINAAYHMIFIGLDGQRLNQELRDGGYVPVYNDAKLDGMVYHTGDLAAGSNARYDANDITEEKKEELLNYLRAGYPIVVEDECFRKKTARGAKAQDINTERIQEGTQMHAFFREALLLGKAEEKGEYDDLAVGLYTIQDVHSSAMFAEQLNALRPKVTATRAPETPPEGAGAPLAEGTGTGGAAQEKTPLGPYDQIWAKPVAERPGTYRCTFVYQIASDRPGEDKTYPGALEAHLYLDFNYDGVFAPEEETTAFQHAPENGKGTVSVDFQEVSFGVVPWKFELRDVNNPYRRAFAQSSFLIRGEGKAKFRILQILADKESESKKAANLQAMVETYKKDEKKQDYLLASYLKGAEAATGMAWEIQTLAPAEFVKLLEPAQQTGAAARDGAVSALSQWDVLVLGFGDQGSYGGHKDAVAAAVNSYIEAGGGVLLSSAGASDESEKDGSGLQRLGLQPRLLGQEEIETVQEEAGQRERGKTYGKLSLSSGEKFRYQGINKPTELFEKKKGSSVALSVDRINDGLITGWPYVTGKNVKLDEELEVHAPGYLLDIGRKRKAEEAGEPCATAWFTLQDDAGDVVENVEEGAKPPRGYSVSPRDGANNYYVYSRGSVVYVGQSEYPYLIPLEGESAAAPKAEGETSPSGDIKGEDACRIFANALVAAYVGQTHAPRVSMVNGFQASAEVKGVTVPFDAALKEAGDAQGGILGEKVDVYFTFEDNNAALDKVTSLSFYYKNVGTGGNVSLLSVEGKLNPGFTPFESPLWTIEKNRLVEVDTKAGGLLQGRVYRIKAPVTALQGGDHISQICVLVSSGFTRADKKIEVKGAGSVALNRAQMFLLE